MTVILWLTCATLIINNASVSGDVNGQIFSQALTNLSNTVLRIPTVQKATDNLPLGFTSFQVETNVVAMIAKNVSIYFNVAFAAVDKLKQTLEAEYQQGYFNDTQSPNCCNVNASQMEYNYYFQKKVDSKQPCYVVPDDGKPSHQIPTSLNLSKTFRNNFSWLNSIKWQYYATEEGVLIMYPTQYFNDCRNHDERYSSWYLETVTPVPKDIVVVFDRSNSMRAKRMQTAKDASKVLIRSLKARDKVGVVAFSDVIRTPPGCYSEELAFATDNNKDALCTYLDDLHATGSTNYHEALTTAFRLFRKNVTSDSDTPRQKVILFLTDGGATKAPDFILKLIADLNGKLNNEVIILTYGIGNELDNTAKELLTKMATQTMSDPTKGNITRGTFTPVDNIDDLRLSLSSYYKQFSSTDRNSTPVVSSPYIDQSGLLTVKLSKPVFRDRMLQGVAGVDVRLTWLRYLAPNSDSNGYVFMIDNFGRTLLHHLLPIPSTSKRTAQLVVDISTLEPIATGEGVISSMKRREEGEKTIEIKSTRSRGHSHLDGVISTAMNVTYMWTPIAGTPFSFCYVSPCNLQTIVYSCLLDAKVNRFVYHRLDLKTHMTPLCRIGKRLGTRNAPVMKFTTAAFVNPMQYLNRIENARTVRLYEQFLMGESVSNSNLKCGIKTAAWFLYKLDDLWMSTDYPYWRYIGDYIYGVFKVYPGTVLPKNYDPVMRRWYVSAVANDGDLVLTPPYVDAFGSGIVLTLSKALVWRSSKDTHSVKDKTVAVIAMDLKLNTVKSMLSTAFPSCDDSDKSCFLVDKSGFTVYHEDFLQSDTDRVEYVHISEQEGAIAADLIKKNLMKEKSCLGVYTKKTYITWQVTIENKIDNMNNLPAYSLEPVPGSNIFLGIKKKEPKKSTICHSCPINVNGDVGQCRQYGQTCHCPCYLSTGFALCRNNISEDSKYMDLCTPELPNVIYSSPVENETAWVATLQLCFPTRCPDMNFKSECDDYPDCEWCDRGTDGLKTSPCQKKGACYKKPKTPNPGSFSLYVIIGPVAAAAFVVVLVAAIVVMYRRRTAMTHVQKDGDYDNAAPCVATTQVNPAAVNETSPEEIYEVILDVITENNANISGVAAGNDGYDDTVTRSTDTDVRPVLAGETAPDGGYQALLGPTHSPGYITLVNVTATNVSQSGDL